MLFLNNLEGKVSGQVTPPSVAADLGKRQVEYFAIVKPSESWVMLTRLFSFAPNLFLQLFKKHKQPLDSEFEQLLVNPLPSTGCH